MQLDKPNTQALFHFLLSELIVESSEHLRSGEEETAEARIKAVGKELGFKIYTQICLKRGITERPSTVA